MVSEDYVSFETAKLLKDKGFKSDDCHTAYDENGEFFWYGDYSKDRAAVMDAPTLQIAMKWLRKVHKLEITPFHDMIQGNAWWYRIERNTYLSLLTEFEEDCIFATYEQAVESAIKYCLEILL